MIKSFNRIIILTVLFFFSINMYSQELRIDAQLNFGSTSINCYKKYKEYEIDKVLSPDTIFYNPPKLIGFFYEESKNRRIKVYPHPKYILATDPMTGEIIVHDKYIEDSIFTNTFFGKIKSDSLYLLLTSQITLSDKNGIYESFSNFDISISGDKGFFEINSCQGLWECFLKYELSRLKEGDIVIVSLLNFHDSKLERSYSIGTGYWTIE